MNVKDLRRELRQYPDTAEVYVSPEGWGWWKIGGVSTDPKQPGPIVFIDCDHIAGKGPRVRAVARANVY